MKNIAVYCGSHRGTNPKFTEKAAEMGRLLAQESIQLVYGGGMYGLMGIIADAVLASGGKVIGVAPHFLGEREVIHSKLTKLHMVTTMAQRKAKMIKFADGYIAMPGAYGTLEEISEVLTESILGNSTQKAKPIGFLNVDGYWDLQIAMLDKFVADGFLHQNFRDNALVAAEPAELLALMRNFKPKHHDKFINESLKK
jgi:uncharacterized protein (TIGR00730 family)